MKSLPRRVLFALAFGISLFGASAAQADLVVAYWNFNNYTAPNTSISADQGSGTIAINGFLPGDLIAPGGTTINALGSDGSGRSLGLLDFVSNGGFLDFSVSLTGFEDPSISFATRRNSPNGFDVNSFSFSVDGGTNFTPAFSVSQPNPTFITRTSNFSAFDAVDNIASVIFRYTLDGATNSSAFNYIDNVQIIATATVPEPSAFLFGGLVCSLLGLGSMVRKQRRQS